MVAFQAAGADFQFHGSSVNFGFYLYQIGFPRPACMVFGVAYLVACYCMFSADIASP
jgi:hypothetical protein